MLSWLHDTTTGDHGGALASNSTWWSLYGCLACGGSSGNDPSGGVDAGREEAIRHIGFAVP